MVYYYVALFYLFRYQLFYQFGMERMLFPLSVLLYNKVITPVSLLHTMNKGVATLSMSLLKCFASVGHP